MDVKGEYIKIWLSIDEKQERDTAYWYHWLPESGNGFYCMPEIGAQVYLYIGGKNEKNAMAVGLSGKRILFQAPGEISIIRKDMIQLTMTVHHYWLCFMR